ncbi:ASPIC/UnbV domain-containing protein [Mucilaginibacter sp. P19]|uniref:ASPIC/UnbV domain-containing protein n=1 Tax=Mucilaginibacter sp. P19 TaxID=3423947 RepID=UPI003D67E63E
MDLPTFSNGAAYADLDNDGAMDMVINNINDQALIYKNNSRALTSKPSNYLQVKLNGNNFNRDGIGAWVDIYYAGKQHQVYENNPYRGYLSSIQNVAHFGLGKVNKLDSVVVRWPNNYKQVLKNVSANQTLKVNINDARQAYSWVIPQKNRGHCLLKLQARQVLVTGTRRMIFRILPFRNYCLTNFRRMLRRLQPKMLMATGLMILLSVVTRNFPLRFSCSRLTVNLISEI